MPSDGLPLWKCLAILFQLQGDMVPKQKTHKGASKRFQFSGSGKLMRTRHMKSHLRRRKSARTKRELDEMLVVAPADAKRIARLIPFKK